MVGVTPHTGYRLVGRRRARRWADREPGPPASPVLPERAQDRTMRAGDKQVEVVGVAPDGGYRLARRRRARRRADREPGAPAVFVLLACARAVPEGAHDCA